MGELVETKLIYRTESGKLLKAPVTLKYENGRIWFADSPRGMKDEIKAMGGSHWHGYDNPKIMMWSVDDNFRNQFQLHYMMGENVYEWFEQDLIEHEYSRPLMEHQKDLTNRGLTYHYQIWAAEMGTGKTLSAQEVIERSGVKHWYWVGPKTSLPNIRREFKKWNFVETCATIEYMTYEKLVRLMDEHKDGNPLPGGVIFDESSRLKTATSQRSKAAFKLANLIRGADRWGGYVILMSGTPSPKRPTDWFSQCEVAWPGFLREGSVKAIQNRLAFMVQHVLDSGTFWKPMGWRDDENKCNICGHLEDEGPHVLDMEEYHEFVPSKNEVAYMFERLNGLVVVKHKKDCLTLPDKRYRKVECTPSKSLLRVAKTLVDAAPNAMTGMTLLRELSDGFQYREVDDGTKPCNHCPESKGIVDEWFHGERIYQDISLLEDDLVDKLEKRKVECPKCHGTGEMKKTKRITREIPCPKEKALRELLEECEETGRIVVFAGFTGSVDRCVSICHKEGWAVVRCDGRGFQVTLSDGTTITDEEALDFWANLEDHPRVAFVAHPESGGMSLTLVEARMAVYWSNSFKPEYRVQSEDRIHRKGMDENLGCVIVDLIHLPTDERVVDIIRENRKLELMTMGKIMEGIQWNTEDTP
jgi:SNF2 family DNA or RNA helicase